MFQMSVLYSDTDIKSRRPQVDTVSATMLCSIQIHPSSVRLRRRFAVHVFIASDIGLISAVPRILPDEMWTVWEHRFGANQTKVPHLVSLCVFGLTFTVYWCIAWFKMKMVRDISTDFKCLTQHTATDIIFGLCESRSLHKTWPYSFESASCFFGFGWQNNKVFVVI